MNIWRIGYDYEYPSLMIPDKYTNLASPENDQSDEVFYYFEGIPLKQKWTPLDFLFENDPKYTKGRPDFIRDEEFGCSPVILEAFGNKLLEDIEPLPIFIESQPFYIIHILKFVDCLDIERSEIVYDEPDDVQEQKPINSQNHIEDEFGEEEYEDEENLPQPVFINLEDNLEDNNPFGISHIKKFVMNSERITDCMLFRVPEKFVYLFATDKFRDIYIASGFTGLTFTPVEVI